MTKENKTSLQRSETLDAGSYEIIRKRLLTQRDDLVARVKAIAPKGAIVYKKL